MRIRFSLRALIIVVTLICVVIGLAMQFGPHVIWKTLDREISSGVEPIPTKPLVDEQPEEPLVLCTVGPVSFEMPERMTNSFKIEDGFVPWLVFWDDKRQLVIQLPYPDQGIIQEVQMKFPEKSTWNSVRLEAAIYEAKSADFSWFMSHHELSWHQWLLEQRLPVPKDAHLLEYICRSDLEANLVHTKLINFFDWNTVDGKTRGRIYFSESAPERDGSWTRADGPWMRHVCSTFKLKGDPLVFNDKNVKTIESMVKFSAGGNPRSQTD